MAVGGKITTKGKNLFLRRLYLSDKTVVNTGKVGTGTATPSASDTDLDTPTITKTFVSGYPLFDESAKKVTTRLFISSVEGNGTAISEVGEFNTDSPKEMISRDVFTAISKTSGDEIAVIITHKVID